MAEGTPDRGARLVAGLAEDVVERLRGLTELVGRAGAGTLGAVTDPAAEVLRSLSGLVQQAPPPTAALDLFLEELRAKKALVEALQVQLTSFAAQLDVLERSLAPLQTWGQQWSAVQDGFVEALRLRPDRPS